MENKRKDSQTLERVPPLICSNNPNVSTYCQQDEFQQSKLGNNCERVRFDGQKFGLDVFAYYYFRKPYIPGEGRFETETFEKAEKSMEALLNFSNTTQTQTTDNIRTNWLDFVSNAKKWCEQKSYASENHNLDKVRIIIANF